MQKLIFVSLLCAVGTLPAISQKGTGQTAKRLPSPVPPSSSSCRLTIGALRQVTGSLVYRRLKYEVAALKLGQESVETLNRSNEDIQKAENITNLLSSMIQSTDDGKDGYDCAAYIVRIAPTNADDKAFMAGLAKAYEAESWVLSDLVAYTKESLLRPGQATNAQQIRDAERSAARTKKQNEAATTILEMTTYTLLTSIDLSDKNAKTTEYLAMTCAEKSDLEEAIEELAGKPESAFTVPATFIKKVLTEHKCRA